MGDYQRRRRPTREQLAILEDAYERDAHPTRYVKAQLARQLSVEYKHIQVWSQNRRAKQRRREREGATVATYVRTLETESLYNVFVWYNIFIHSGRLASMAGSSATATLAFGYGG